MIASWVNSTWCKWFGHHWRRARKGEGTESKTCTRCGIVGVKKSRAPK